MAIAMQSDMVEPCPNEFGLHKISSNCAVKAGKSFIIIGFRLVFRYLLIYI
jgi:hypothetical protein